MGHRTLTTGGPVHGDPVMCKSARKTRRRKPPRPFAHDPETRRAPYRRTRCGLSSQRTIRRRPGRADDQDVRVYALTYGADDRRVVHVCREDGDRGFSFAAALLATAGGADAGRWVGPVLAHDAQRPLNRPVHAHRVFSVRVGDVQTHQLSTLRGVSTSHPFHGEPSPTHSGRVAPGTRAGKR
jgi:hypothetical protein